MRSYQYGIDVKTYVNGREGMFSVRRSGKSIFERFWRQGKIWLRVEVDDIEWRRSYKRSQFMGGTDLVP